MSVCALSVPFRSSACTTEYLADVPLFPVVLRRAERKEREAESWDEGGGGTEEEGRVIAVRGENLRPQEQVA